MIESVRIGKNYCIEQVLVNGKNIIYPWGIETADAWAFFTQEWRGYRHKILDQYGEEGKDFNCAEFIVQMREGKWHLKIDESWNSQTIIRRHDLVCLEDSWFMDFVSRYVFKSCIFPKAEIAGQIIPHQNYYRNYQYSVRQVRLFGADLEVTVDLIAIEAPDKFKPLMYVRGAQDSWVVHVRLFPAIFEKKVVKRVKGVKMATPIPQPIANLLLAIPPLRNKIWYAGDRGDWSWPINGLGLVRLSKGSTVKLESKVMFKANKNEF
jgi:hypothetical protein